MVVLYADRLVPKSKLKRRGPHKDDRQLQTRALKESKMGMDYLGACPEVLEVKYQELTQLKGHATF